jgi:hypothetical protein
LSTGRGVPLLSLLHPPNSVVVFAAVSLPKVVTTSNASILRCGDHNQSSHIPHHSLLRRRRRLLLLLLLSPPIYNFTHTRGRRLGPSLYVLLPSRCYAASRRFRVSLHVPIRCHPNSNDVSPTILIYCRTHVVKIQPKEGIIIRQLLVLSNVLREKLSAIWP